MGLKNGSNRTPPMTVSHSSGTEMCFVSASDVPLPVDLRLRWEERDEVGSLSAEERGTVWGGGGPLLRATSIACGSSHSLVSTDEGRVLVWGRGKSGANLGKRPMIGKSETSLCYCHCMLEKLASHKLSFVHLSFPV